MNGRRPTFAFVLLLGLSIAAWWRPIATTLRLAVDHDEYTHVLLIVPVSVALIALDRHLFRRAGAPSIAWGAPLLAISGLAALLGRHLPGVPQDERLTLIMVGLVGWWLGSFIACFGAGAFRLFLFPLLFLLWFIPFPLPVLDGVVRLLQEGSAWLADAMFTAAGVPVRQDGLLLSIPGLTMEVAKECSSIRSSLMLVVCSMVLAHLFLQSLWRKVVVCAVAVFLTIGKNALRIFTIAMLGTRVDPAFLTGKLHHRGGIWFFLIAQAAIMLLVWLLQRGEGGPSPGSLAPRRGQAAVSHL